MMFSIKEHLKKMEDSKKESLISITNYILGLTPPRASITSLRFLMRIMLVLTLVVMNIL
jgi:hypothetical protein